jgi:hypothetical protein
MELLQYWEAIFVLYACTAFTSDSKPSLNLSQSIMSHNKELQHSGFITRSKKWTSSSILKLSLIDELLVDVALSIVAIVISFRTDVEVVEHEELHQSVPVKQ